MADILRVQCLWSECVMVVGHVRKDLPLSNHFMEQVFPSPHPDEKTKAKIGKIICLNSQSNEENE